VLHDRAGADDAVDQAGVRPELAPGPDDAAALEDRVGGEGDVGGEVDGRVDVGAFGIDHGDALAHPGRVGAAAQLGLGGGQLEPVVDALGVGGVVGHHGRDPVPGTGEDLD